MSNYNYIKGKLFRVQDVDNGTKSLEEWCEFYVKYVLECHELYRDQKQEGQINSYSEFLEKYFQNRVLIVSKKEVYTIHVDGCKPVNPSMVRVVNTEDNNQLNFELISDGSSKDWTEKLKEAL